MTDETRVVMNRIQAINFALSRLRHNRRRRRSMGRPHANHDAAIETLCTLREQIRAEAIAREERFP